MYCLHYLPVKGTSWTQYPLTRWGGFKCNAMNVLYTAPPPAQPVEATHSGGDPGKQTKEKT